MDRGMLKLFKPENKKNYFMEYEVGDYVIGYGVYDSPEPRELRGWVVSHLGNGVRIRLDNQIDKGLANLTVDCGDIVKVLNPMSDKPFDSVSVEEKDDNVTALKFEISEELSILSDKVIKDLTRITTKYDDSAAKVDKVYRTLNNVIGYIDDFLQDRTLLEGDETISELMEKVEFELEGCKLLTWNKKLYVILCASYSRMCNGEFELLVAPARNGYDVLGDYALDEMISLNMGLEEIHNGLDKTIKHKVTWSVRNNIDGFSVKFFGKTIGDKASVELY